MLDRSQDLEKSYIDTQHGEDRNCVDHTPRDNSSFLDKNT